MAQNTVTEIKKTGNLHFTDSVKEKTQDLYYSDTRTIASAASDFSAFALGGKVEVGIPEDLPEASLAVVDDAYLVKPNIPVTKAPGVPRKEIITYTVQGGDTLISIARKFNISTNTILWANSRLELQADGDVKIDPGNRLAILPVNGVLYVVQGNETLAGIVKRYHGSLAMTRNFNRLDSDKLRPGQKLVIPDGRKAKPKPLPEPEPEEETQIADMSDYNSDWRYNYGDSAYYGGGSGSFPGGWCTSYVATRRNITWLGHAGAWFYNTPRPTGRTPIPGAIVCTAESGWGHVAYVEQVYSNGTFRVSEWNMPYGNFYKTTYRTITTSSVPLIGFIY